MRNSLDAPLELVADGEVKIEIHRDHTIFRPPPLLKQKVWRARQRGDRTPEEIIAAGEKALAATSVKYRSWLDGELEGLRRAWTACRDTQYSREATAVLFQAAHHVRGNGAIFGFPLASLAADSLCRLIDRVETAPMPTDLVDHHVDAVAAIVREAPRDERGARQLVDALRDATRRALAPRPGEQAAA